MEPLLDWGYYWKNATASLGYSFRDISSRPYTTESVSPWPLRSPADFDVPSFMMAISPILRDWRSHKCSHDRQIRKLSLDPFWPFPFSEASLTPPHPSSLHPPPFTPSPSATPPPCHLPPDSMPRSICQTLLFVLIYVRDFWHCLISSVLSLHAVNGRCTGIGWNPGRVLHPVADWRSMESSPNPTPRCWSAVVEILSESYTPLLIGGRWNPLRMLHPVADRRSLKSSPNPTPCCWHAVDEILSEPYTLLLIERSMKSFPNPTPCCWLVLRILHPVADWSSMKSSLNPTPRCWLVLRILHPVADWRSMKSFPNPTPRCWLALRILHPVADWRSMDVTTARAIFTGQH